MKTIKYITVIAVVAALIAGGAYYFFRPEPIPLRVNPVKPPTDKSLAFEGGTLIERKDGKIIWQISGESIELNTDQTSVAIIKPQVMVYNEGQAGQVKLSASQANYDIKTKNLKMTGGVQAVNDKGADFKADQAEWRGESMTVVATGNVVYNNGQTSILGDVIETDKDFKRVKVQGNAKMKG